MVYFLAAFGLYLLARRLVPRWTAWKNRSAAERSFAVRYSLFIAALGVILIVVVLHVPPLAAAMLMLPIFVIGMTLAKWWQSTRERLRRESEEASNFERARRIN
jgi:Flp pilus assembly protein TadB